MHCAVQNDNFDFLQTHCASSSLSIFRVVPGGCLLYLWPFGFIYTKDTESLLAFYFYLFMLIIAVIHLYCVYILIHPHIHITHPSSIHESSVSP